MPLDVTRPPTRKAKRKHTRESIKSNVTDLLIRHGYRGASMSKIAEAVGSTTTNIFYHFGSKEKLIDEVVETYVDQALAVQRTIWADDTLSFNAKINEVLELNRERYRRFNSDGGSGTPWSLIGRLRMETDVISDRARADLRRFGTELHEMVFRAMSVAVERGELKSSAPLAEASLLIANVVNSTSALSVEMGSFDKVARFVAACTQMLLDAYGTPGEADAPPGSDAPEIDAAATEPAAEAPKAAPKRRRR